MSRDRIGRVVPRRRVSPITFFPLSFSPPLSSQPHSPPSLCCDDDDDDDDDLPGGLRRTSSARGRDAATGARCRSACSQAHSHSTRRPHAGCCWRSRPPPLLSPSAHALLPLPSGWLVRMPAAHSPSARCQHTIQHVQAGVCCCHVHVFCCAKLCRSTAPWLWLLGIPGECV